eukprot:492010_1
MQIKIEYNLKEFILDPNIFNLQSTEKTDWDDNFKKVRNEIQLKFPSIQNNEFRIIDAHECDIGDGSEFQRLCNDNIEIILKIRCDIVKIELTETHEIVIIPYDEKDPEPPAIRDDQDQTNDIINDYLLQSKLEYAFSVLKHDPINERQSEIKQYFQMKKESDMMNRTEFTGNIVEYMNCNENDPFAEQISNLYDAM